MFDIGWTEIALIVGVSVVVIGPEDMPRALYNLGKVVKKIKKFSSDIQRSLEDITREGEVDVLAHELNTKIGGPNVQFEIERQIAEEERQAAFEESGVPAEYPQKKG